jgi:rubredoxin
MAELYRCKTCGYVFETVKPGQVCPACGVPWKMMEPWKDPVSKSRRNLLRLDLHPIIDHFSISFAASALVLALFVLIFPDLFRQGATALLRGLIGVLPLAVIASFVTGLVDGKARFRRTTTPLLTRKKILGALFFVFAAAAAVLTFLAGPYETWVRVADVLLMLGGVLCGVGLGRIGGGLITAIFPG